MLEQSVFESNLVTFISADHCHFWSINPYQLCDFSCTYCIAGVQGKSDPTYEKAQALHIIGETVAQIPSDAPILLGGISDAYPFAEKEHELTRDILSVLNDMRRSYAVVTKGTLVERDIDLLLQNSRSRVVLSFSTLDDKQAAIYEPGAPSPTARLELIELLLSLDIEVQIGLRPWIPTVTHIQDFLDRVPASVPIGLERLKIVRASRTFAIGKKVYSQREIDELYIEERKKYEGCERLTWRMDERFSVKDEGEAHPVILIANDTHDVYRGVANMLD